MAYRGHTVAETARNIAMVAGRALSCDVVAVQVFHSDVPTFDALHVDNPGTSETTRVEIAGPDAREYLAGSETLASPRIEHSVTPDPRVWTQEVVSRMTLSLRAGATRGALRWAMLRHVRVGSRCCVSESGGPLWSRPNCSWNKPPRERSLR